MRIAGLFLMVAALLGLVPPVVAALHGLAIHLENGAAALRWVLGVVAFAGSYLVEDNLLLAKIATWYGLTFIGIGVLGFFVKDQAFWHVGLGDNLLHIALGDVLALMGMKMRSTLRQQPEAPKESNT